MEVDVRPCTEADLARLRSLSTPRDRAAHDERWMMQQRGEAAYLVAWEGASPVGRVTVLHRSKYRVVSTLEGQFPEMNALEADPPGRGIGTAIVAAAERTARELGAGKIGLAVEERNVDARRLYERLGYVEWRHGSVVDRWNEMDESGVVVRAHADPCAYLVKELR